MVFRATSSEYCLHCSVYFTQMNKLQSRLCVLILNYFCRSLKCVLCCSTCVPDRHLLTLWTWSGLSSVAALSTHSDVYIPLDDVSLATVCHTAGLISVWVAAGLFCPAQKGGPRSGQQNQWALRSYLLWCKCITRGSRRKWCRALREEGDERIRCLFRALSPILGPLQQIKIISQTDS